VDLKKDNFVGREALALEAKKGPERALVGLEIDWNEVEALYEALEMARRCRAWRREWRCRCIELGSKWEGDFTYVVADFERR